MQPALPSAIVIELAAYRRPLPPDDDPPPSSRGARPLPRSEFTDLDAVDRRVSERLLAYAS
jgi:hypothetical protein